MNKILPVSLILACCFSAGARNKNVLPYKDASLPVETRVEDLLSRMTLDEKIAQLNQYSLGENDNVNNLGAPIDQVPAEIGSLIYFNDDAVLRNEMQRRAVEETRLGIPILFGYDVIHGFRTIYPIPLAIGASWNPELAGKACRTAAQEAYDAGINWTFSPMVDIARDARWGRIAEGYGEDPYLTSVFGAAAVKAYQGDDLSAENNIAACLKHYVGYGASEAGRDYVPTEISRQTLWDTYLPSFKAGVEAGAVTLMSSFNNISGTPGSANHYTMTEVLKEKWSHDGFVVADWNAVDQLINQGLASDRKEAAMYAFNAGLDMDMVDDCYQQHLAELVSEGKVTMDRVDDAVRRVLKVKFMLGLFDRPYTEEKPESEWSLLPESLETVEQLAQETMVLLKNDSGVLPLKPDVSRIALIGPMAKTQEHLLGSWSGKGRAEDVTSIYAGLAGILPQTQLIYAQGCGFDGDDMSGFAEAVAAADSADIVILCLGEKRNWSGENASRSTVALPLIQEKLLEAVKTVGKPVVVLLSNGRALDLTRISPVADAVLEIWQPGVRAGQAVAGILTGKYNPSGKLPVTFPYTTGQIPIYYNHRNLGQVMLLLGTSSPQYGQRLSAMVSLQDEGRVDGGGDELPLLGEDADLVDLQGPGPVYRMADRPEPSLGGPVEVDRRVLAGAGVHDVAVYSEGVVHQGEDRPSVAATHAVHLLGTELHLADDLFVGYRHDLDAHLAGEWGVVHVHDVVHVLLHIVAHPREELFPVHGSPNAGRLFEIWSGCIDHDIRYCSRDPSGSSCSTLGGEVSMRMRSDQCRQRPSAVSSL